MYICTLYHHYYAFYAHVYNAICNDTLSKLNKCCNIAEVSMLQFGLQHMPIHCTYDIGLF